MEQIGPLTHLVLTSRMRGLMRLQAAIEEGGIQSKDDFADMMTACFVHAELSTTELAAQFGQPEATVGMWRRGRSLPDPDLWPSIVDWSVQALADKITEIDSMLKADEAFFHGQQGAPPNVRLH